MTNSLTEWWVPRLVCSAAVGRSIAPWHHIHHPSRAPTDHGDRLQSVPRCTSESRWRERQRMLLVPYSTYIRGGLSIIRYMVGRQGPPQWEKRESGTQNMTYRKQRRKGTQKQTSAEIYLSVTLNHQRLGRCSALSIAHKEQLTCHNPVLHKSRIFLQGWKLRPTLAPPQHDPGDKELTLAYSDPSPCSCNHHHDCQSQGCS